ncbi:hypothetical protein B484DRAFT_470961 [Ochromonadaceae sp. CCMP2298]|nr:hypothetical protein B484DRAFT_470961 [Ochromonadaceae sp. CCMP2298]
MQGAAYAKGDEVQARWKGQKAWYAGKIKRRNKDDSYDINYDDGDKELNVAAKLVKDKNERKGHAGNTKNQNKRQRLATETNQQMPTTMGSTRSGTFFTTINVATLVTGKGTEASKSNQLPTTPNFSLRKDNANSTRGGSHSEDADNSSMSGDESSDNVAINTSRAPRRETRTFLVRPSFSLYIQSIINDFESRWTFRECLLKVLQRKMSGHIPLKPDENGVLNHSWNLDSQELVTCLHCMGAKNSEFNNSLLFGDVGSFISHVGGKDCVNRAAVHYKLSGKSKKSWQPVKVIQQKKEDVEEGVDTVYEQLEAHGGSL